MQINEPLKPCPFCGTIPRGNMSDFVYPVGRFTDLFQCTCIDPDCGCSVLGYDERSAINAWNSRAYDEKIENLEIENEVVNEYNITLRKELTDAYKHTSKIETQLDVCLFSLYGDMSLNHG